jgi:hypothetical protein
MSARDWGPRTFAGEARNDCGEVDADGLWRFQRRDRKQVTRGLRDVGLVSLGTRDVGLVSLGTRKAEDPEVKRAMDAMHRAKKTATAAWCMAGTSP